MASKLPKELSESKTLLPIFPLTRRLNDDLSHNAYYPFGNTPAEDYLECKIDNPHPSVLILGCGDLRSCFYTLWKNFYSSIPGLPYRFTGVQFTMNDNNAAVLARNVLFLYLCIKLPDNSLDRKQWISTMWAIWYCHELYPNHLRVLDDSLKYLLAFSDSLEKWNYSGNLLHSFVQFGSSNCLLQVRRMWLVWLDKLVPVSSVEEMQESRCQTHGKLNDSSEHCYNFTKDNILVYGDKDNSIKEKIHARSPEVKSYITTGSCFAESVFRLHLTKQRRCINLTMYDSEDGLYRGFFALMPFICFYHTYEFTPTKLQSLLPKEDVLVSSSSFVSYPFLANSVQQFSMWVQSTNRILKRQSVLFSIHLQDAIEFCCTMQQKNHIVPAEDKKIFDMIVTSNLMDHIGPVNLVLSCVPLLKQDGLLKTMTMSCRFCKSTREEFLNLCFGIDCQLFPTVLGIRCIDLDGGELRSSVLASPFLPDLTHIQKRLPHNRSFIWEKIGALPTVLSQLPAITDGSVTEALVNGTGVCVYSLLNYSYKDTKSIIIPHGIESAVLMLQQFISQCSGTSGSHHFWDPFCTALREVFQPYLQCLQTQMLLHNIHTHLTMTEEDCPLCKRQPLESVLQFFMVSLPEAYLPSIAHFYALVHKSSSKNLKTLKSMAMQGKDVHIFDAFHANKSKNSVELKFFVPQFFIKGNYKLTIVIYSQLSSTEAILSTSLLENSATGWQNYEFLAVPTKKYQNGIFKMPTELGTVISHICERNKSETEILLSAKAQVAADGITIDRNKSSPWNIVLNCNTFNLPLRLRYPVDIENIKITRPVEDKLCIVCIRQTKQFYEERHCLIANPDNKLSLPHSDIGRTILTKQTHMQFSVEEEEVLQLSISNLPPIARVKLTMQKLFTKFTSQIIKVVLESNNKCCGVIITNGMLYDYQRRTPALDVMFSFQNQTDISSDTLEGWMKSIQQSRRTHIKVQEDEFLELKESFCYFSDQTNAIVDHAVFSSRFPCMEEVKSKFKRAVVYLLLCDPDVKFCRSGEETRFSVISAERNSENIGGTKCSNCGKLSFTIKKCGQCKKVFYCSKICQEQHWHFHKRSCLKFNLTTMASLPDTTEERKIENAPKCDHCKAYLGELDNRVCCLCNSARYCSRNCQEKHWNAHKQHCATNSKLDSTATQQALRCSYCNNAKDILLKCLGCRKAQYCNKLCQKNHWAEHKKSCSPDSGGINPQPKHAKPEVPAEGYKAYGARKKGSEKCHSAKDLCEEISEKPQEGAWNSINPIYHNKGKTKSSDYNPKAHQTSGWSDCRIESEALASHLSRSSGKKGPLRETGEVCDCCGRESSDLKRCTRCYLVKYCSKDCQKSHWPTHKLSCK